MSVIKLMFITNRADIAEIAENAGVDRIFIDLESLGKAERQGGLDTVMSDHKIEDVKTVKAVLKKAELLVRINPVHDAKDDIISTEEEIDKVIDGGADIIMLPYYKTLEEVKRFIGAVHGRVRTMLLIETAEAVDILDDTLKLNAIDEYHIGINDLSLSLNKKHMFELLADGTVESITKKLKKAGAFYGFGGIASIGRGDIPAERIILEHYRLGSKMAILSRSFCNVSKMSDIDLIRQKFDSGVNLIRYFEGTIVDTTDFEGNRAEIKKIVKELTDRL